MKNTYSQAVRNNLKHMGTSSSQWSAVEITGTEETQGPDGVINMPKFSFPSGYKKAPTLYPTASGQDCCEWCGTNIKKIYWIKNDSKKWIMQVGSECVTHFGEGKSGERLSKESIWSENRDFLRKTESARKALWNAFVTEQYLGYGRTKRLIRNIDAKQVYENLKKITKNVRADEIGFQDASTNSSITRWIKKYKNEALKNINMAHDLINKTNNN